MTHTPTDKLLSEVTDFLAETGMGVSYFGKISSGNSELVHRLKNGGRVWPETADRVRSFMKAHRSAVRKSAPAEGVAS
jgi:hypothetical protein